jgi:hypothetical protein
MNPAVAVQEVVEEGLLGVVYTVDGISGILAALEIVARHKQLKGQSHDGENDRV